MLNDLVYLLVFKISGEEFAVEIKNVQEIIRNLHITRVPCTYSCMLGVINVRGIIIPVMDIARKIGSPPDLYNEDSRIIIISYDNQLLGLIVNSASEAIRISPKNVEKMSSFSAMTATDYFFGIGKLGNRLISILDIKKIFIIPSGNEKYVRRII